MYYLLFIFYLAVFCLAILRIDFIKNSGLSKRTIIFLFIMKVAAGIGMGWITLHYLGGGDYHAANVYAKQEYELLRKHPSRFFTDLFDTRYSNGLGGMFDSLNSFWHDLAGNILYKLLALCNIFSRGNFYINNLFLNFIGFFGHIALFRVFADVFKDAKWSALIGCFLLPSLLYFSSGLHKDTLVFTLIGVYSFALYFLRCQAISSGRIAWLIIAAIGIFLIRNFVLVALIPASIAFWLTHKKAYAWKSFAGVYGLAIVLLISVVLLFPNKNPLHIVAKKQQAYFALERGHTQVALDTLHPNIPSLLKNLPAAITHSFTGPSLGQQPAKYLLLPAIEIVIYLLIMAMALFFTVRHRMMPHRFVLFGIALTATLFIITGLTVPNFGAIIRYRSLFLPFLLTPALATLEYIRFKNI